MAIVEYRNVCKQFANGTVALKNFNLHINDGELVVLVGPSGCGKSTALRLLAGLENLSSGEILIGGKVVNVRTPQQRNIAMVFQNYALYPHMDVRRNLEFPLRMLKTSRVGMNSKITEIAEILNLQNLLDRKPAQLSGGQRQRVAMGRALVRDPSVFLLDEPLSNLDAKLRAQIRADISALQQRLRKTTLYVTHDQVEAMTLGDRVAVMENGELHQVGTPAELYQRPRSIFVARFIGNPGMNVFSSSFRMDMDGTWQVRAGEQNIPLPTDKLSQQQSLHPKKSVYVGFRPESIRTSPGNNTIRCRVAIASTEFLGHETLVHFHFLSAESEKPLVARIPGQFKPSGDMTDLFISPDALFLFDEDETILQ
ncbi:MAG: ABC transporter ATP-binding protein [Desulfobulbales bacterium]